MDCATPAAYDEFVNQLNSVKELLELLLDLLESPVFHWYMRPETDCNVAHGDSLIKTATDDGRGEREETMELLW